MVPFSGWWVPLLYDGIVSEHKAVRSAAGLFDVSHMGKIIIGGEKAHENLQRLSPNTVPDTVGKGVYTHLLRDDGTIIDDVIITLIDENQYLCVCNAVVRDEVVSWFRKNLPLGILEDLTSDLLCLALQGPNTTKVSDVVFPRNLVGNLRPFAVRSVDVADLEPECVPVEMKGGLSEGSTTRSSWSDRILISRTGYTGEDGIEIITPTRIGVPLWRFLLEIGRESGLVPAGLGSRDTLRLEKGYLLSGQDFDGTQTPLETGHNWLVKWDHEFIGREALLQQKEAGDFKRLSGIRLRGPGIPRHGASVRHEGQPVGIVTSGTLSPTLDVGIALAYLPPGVAKPGTEVEIEVRKAVAPGTVVALPFL
jgi:aminomethyltransferase